MKRILYALTISCSVAVPCVAQVTPAAGYTPPDDTPKISVGATIFTDYTIQVDPKITDADGNSTTLSSFNVGRSYINITGNISHSISFRITPDIARETASGPALSGSYIFRLKYAFAQWNLDDYMTKGSWLRFGQQQTPYVDYAEGIYRYRFQGTTFIEREGYQSSADAGVSFHYNFANNYGDLHTGLYNGENYNKPEVNDQKGFKFRGTVRPLARGSTEARGLRITGYIDDDHYIKSGDRFRGEFAVTYEHPNLSASVEYLATKDQTSVSKTQVDGKGWSIWVTPRSKIGWEALFRYDHMEPNTSADTSNQTRTRTIIGVAYWFPHQGNVSTALLLDYDDAQFHNLNQPEQKKIAVHALVNF
jgi:hypothetical protein